MLMNTVLFILITVVLILITTVFSSNEHRCFAISILNNPITVKRDLLNCTVVEGDVKVSLIVGEHFQQEDYPVFHSLREITGYLLVTQVRGLRSLSHMFPALRVIGGYQLVLNYALIVYQNPDLQEIGLRTLTLIRNGGVRIVDNIRLCRSRVRSINWEAILLGNVKDLLVDDVRGQQVTVPYGHCGEDGCAKSNSTRCHAPLGVTSCWDAEYCQIDCIHGRLENGYIGPGCDDWGRRCHEECIGGCSSPNSSKSCFACRYVSNDGFCVEKCPNDKYNFEHSRRCMNRSECLALDNGFKAFNGQCHFDCPSGYQVDPLDNTNCLLCDHCPRRCPGGQIGSVESARDFDGCEIIEGDLLVEMWLGGSMTKVDETGGAMEELTKYLGQIKEITDYLVVRFSSSLISLSIFRSLTLIRGQKLFRDRYALVVFENKNLRKLFDLPNQNITLENGTVQFQNNRMLCYDHVAQLIEHLDLTKKMNEFDVSQYSNGDRAICQQIELNVSTLAAFKSGWSIEVEPLDLTGMDQRNYLGHIISFKESVNNTPANDTIVDDTIDDTWNRIFISNEEYNKNNYALVYDEYKIKGNTLYAYYVQSEVVNHEGAMRAISRVRTVLTLFGKPDPPSSLNLLSDSSNSLAISWQPPRHPQGVITHYMVNWTRLYEKNNNDSSTVCSTGTRNPKSQLDETHKTRQQAASINNKCDGYCSNKMEQCSRNPLISESAQKANEVVEMNRFENAIHNILFPEYETRRKRRSSSIDITITTTTSLTLIDDPSSINVTSINMTITGLHHFTIYEVSVWACQDTTAEEHHCSRVPELATARTLPIGKHFNCPLNCPVENDRINRSTVSVFNETETRERLITWNEPLEPNGALLGFRVKAVNIEHPLATPTELCIPIAEFRSNGGGVWFRGLPDGRYSLEVKVLSMNGEGKAVNVDDLFEVRGWLSGRRLAAVIVIVSSLAIVTAIVIYRMISGYYGNKMHEYLNQVMSANPEYISQFDVYKVDEWELSREDIVLDKEIGRGSFGKVYMGNGRSIRSNCGVLFGPCAIKTVGDQATAMDTLRFLNEASIMKQFSTSFVVSLFGVVSDGRPVLVVMELLEKGNLRDYLRSRRPNAEENIHGLPSPTAAEISVWAAQIADGMAYLESLKFCHRDLAARNCMVGADDTVKIGDFGMARDIYYNEYYRSDGKRLVPVRWMAPETLKDGRYTSKSDVWSYGIVLYELVTLAQQPYAGLSNDQVYTFIGLKEEIMRQPKDCPEYWYALMKQCWKFDARNRPTFAQIVYCLLQRTSFHFQKISFVTTNVELMRQLEEETTGMMALLNQVTEQKTIHSENTLDNIDDDVMEDVKSKVTKNRRGLRRIKPRTKQNGEHQHQPDLLTSCIDDEEEVVDEEEC